jgi:hypothetical protein
MVRHGDRRWIAAGAALLASGATAAGAWAAPVISGPDRCLRPGQAPTGQLVSPALVVFGEGFAPGGTVRVSRGFRELTGVADAQGRFRASLSVIDLVDSRVPGVRRLRITAQDLSAAGTAQGAPSNVVRVLVAPLAFSVTPERANPSTRVLFRFSGFAPGRRIHAHYVRAGRVRASRPMVVAGAPCGTAAIRRPQFPMARPAVGAWRVQFDHSARYSPRSRPRLVADVEVYPDR